MPETQNIEYKENWRDEYLKWICGFANAKGGTVYIGKNDNGNVVGIVNAKKLMEDIPNKTKDVLGVIVDVNLHTTTQGDYIEIGQLGAYSLTFRTKFNGFYSDKIFEVHDKPIMSMYEKDISSRYLVA